MCTTIYTDEGLKTNSCIKLNGADSAYNPRKFICEKEDKNKIIRCYNQMKSLVRECYKYSSLYLRCDVFRINSEKKKTHIAYRAFLKTPSDIYPPGTL